MCTTVHSLCEDERTWCSNNVLPLQENLSDPTMRVNMMDVSPKGTPTKQSRDVRHGSLPVPLAMPHSVGDDDELVQTGNVVISNV